jgi:protein-S-isoprenylcysteine O-methyltransferase Ste14
MGLAISDEQLTGESIFRVCLMVLIIAIRLLDEEKFLKQNLAGYSEYCQKVRYHLLPYAW